MFTEKAMEQQLRRALTKQGYQLQKSRARNWSCDDQQGYRIINAGSNYIESGERFDMSLDDVIAFVNG
jgi:hypothetical protein